MPDASTRKPFGWIAIKDARNFGPSAWARLYPFDPGKGYMAVYLGPEPIPAPAPTTLADDLRAHGIEPSVAARKGVSILSAWPIATRG
jgi:hypothetical protein